MPYLSEALRVELDNGRPPTNGGELNYVLTDILLTEPPNEWRQRMVNECVDMLGETPRYEDFNTVIGAVLCCGAEYQRRMEHKHPAVVELVATTCVEIAELIQTRLLAPYEDQKIAENGDVYPTAEAPH